MSAEPIILPAALGRAALYLRVSTGRQAEHDLSIPDQRRQLAAYCQAKRLEIAAYVALGGEAALLGIQSLTSKSASSSGPILHMASVAADKSKERD